MIVVSDGSTDGTDDFLSQPPFELTFAAQANSGPAAARNRGIELAKGELILFIDDDVIAAPDLVEQHLRSHRSGRPGLVVIGPMLTPDGVRLNPWIQWEQRMLYKQYSAMAHGIFDPTFRQFYTGNASVERSALMEVGGFDVRYRRAEDVELGHRLARVGCMFSFNHEAITWHHANRTFESWLSNAHDYGTYDVLLARGSGCGERLRLVSDEFARRNPLTQWTARVAVANRAVEWMLRALLLTLARLGDKVHVERVTRAALSGLYGMAYYCGVAGELGGPQPFHQVIVEARPRVEAT